MSGSGIGRRGFIGGGLAALGGGLVAARTGEGGQGVPKLSFPEGFRWGTATASYQIEGAWNADGRGESIWDRFCRTPGKVKNGDTGDTACDHYNRWREDVALMKELNTTSYRFSIAWPRIQPTGTGAPNAKGLDFYSRLVDGLLEAGLRPFPTLYHWDLPQALEDAGGWPSRDTAERFAEYAGIVAKALGDRVADWMIFNEPNVFVMLGYGMGMHAPGRQDFPAALRASHVVNLAQASAFRTLRAQRPTARIGGAFNLMTFEPATHSEADRDATRRWHLFWNAWFLEPALRGSYPAAFPGLPLEAFGMLPGDLESLRAPFDFIGVNYYTRQIVSTAEPGTPGGLPGTLRPGEDGPRTEFDWEVWPKGFHAAVSWAAKEYGLPIEITENGCAYNDGPGADGKVRDERRIAFYRGYLGELARAIAEGADVRGYHAWSLLDNFEWAEGYTKRFGLVHVDFASQKRTVKESGRWYARLAATGVLPA